MKKQTSVSIYIGHTKRKRPGIHSKKKNSKCKSSKNYKKQYKGQGK